ncbi:MAG: hypothetical protein PHF97_06240 [Bacteroidales bacterium]|nr:hypothetical protein [Bacteroidales bacterium]MDD4603388.1 hypothetical protein [Bacteroidales bacterium]
MKTFEKILVLSNEFEAGLMEEVLTDRKIPHGIVTSEDSALGGIMGLEIGWGYLEAPPEFKKEILKLYGEISKK